MNRLFLVTALALAILGQAGCSKSVKRMDRRDRSSPQVQEAIGLLNKGDKAGAIKAYKRALDTEPLLARVHLDLALLLHDYEKDYVGAIYHYRRYLELRTATEKNEMIQGRINEASQAFVAQNGKAGPREISRPRQDPAAPGPAPSPAARVRTYSVQQNDTLSSIAAEVYKDANAWRKIKDANIGTVDSSGKLRVGQILIIP
ncbi:MAG: hypothetical protein C0404_05510 [Verrucomicrobia bacterium]|nr:hypothetical protein [Verrucomicrobiota bacterium]